MSEDLISDSDLDSLLAHHVYDNLKDFDEPNYRERLLSLLSEREKEAVSAIYNKSILEYTGKDYEKLKEKANKLSYCLKYIKKSEIYKNIKKGLFIKDDITVLDKNVSEETGTVVNCNFKINISRQSFNHFYEIYYTKYSKEFMYTDYYEDHHSTIYVTFMIATEFDKKIEKDFILGCDNKNPYRRNGHLTHIFPYIIFKDWDTIDKYEKKILGLESDKLKYDTADEVLLEIYNKIKLDTTTIVSNELSDSCSQCPGLQDS
jgi:hypothetical protein